MNIITDPIVNLSAKDFISKRKPKVAFTVADNNNLQYAKWMINSLRKFHSEQELPIVIYGQKELDAIDDPLKFYKATPLFGRELIKDYELVIKLDADQIIMGDLSYIWNREDYEVGTVLNINRIDPPIYGFVSTAGIPPNKYFNCGLVAMRSRKMIEHWWELCNRDYINNLQYKEQDILNILCHYGDYRIRCFDWYDNVNQYYGWHGLVAKGEGLKFELRNGEVICPIGEDKYPDKELKVKVYHFAGGNTPNKYNYRTMFNEDMIKHIDWLISDGKK